MSEHRQKESSAIDSGNTADSNDVDSNPLSLWEKFLGVKDFIQILIGIIVVIAIPVYAIYWAHEVGAISISVPVVIVSIVTALVVIGSLCSFLVQRKKNKDSS